ncbi:flagellar basal body L-ring protein FlgH [Maritimibacter alkaliphilus]|uniref:flagellar basal body L-ring protein FlgH n=1 Tax=Maritimibacter alkaliphilus TaxID=404236 RepID=UPI001C940832|nr:flagellar basal body L-ring protein FlgH [Maritimibacter alkaliphilus]MBY6093047.1 flagellar basal body L-ring protein FlgH [Maritimibacter alkaliphilus]
MKSVPLTLVALTGLLAGCGTSPFNRDPEVSSIGFSAGDMAETSTVSVPMPPADPPRIMERAEGASLWQRGSDGFFADQRASRVGDILTIMIEIEDEASLRNATEREREGGGSIGFPSFFGYGTQIDKILPGVDESDLPSGDNIVDITSGTSASGSGTIDRNESISLKVAALVVQMLPNGNMVVAGRQEVKVNQELRELRVAGIIRPQDVQMDNTIDYDKIAEARITYGGRGQLTRQTQRSYGEDAMDIILPY